jgi:hypothetical protein
MSKDDFVFFQFGSLTAFDSTLQRERERERGRSIFHYTQEGKEERGPLLQFFRQVNRVREILLLLSTAGERLLRQEACFTAVQFFVIFVLSLCVERSERVH